MYRHTAHAPVLLCIHAYMEFACACVRAYMRVHVCMHVLCAYVCPVSVFTWHTDELNVHLLKSAFLWLLGYVCTHK